MTQEESVIVHGTGFGHAERNLSKIIQRMGLAESWHEFGRRESAYGDDKLKEFKPERITIQSCKSNAGDFYNNFDGGPWHSFTCNVTIGKPSGK